MRLSSDHIMHAMTALWPRRRRSAPRRPRRRNLRLEQLEPRLALAATPQLVRDINPGTQPFPVNPSELTAVGSTLYFSGETDLLSEKELCKLDDTTGNVVRVKDIWPGLGSSEPESLTAVGSTLYFTADDGVTGRELWKTDGTDGGTVRIKDIRAGKSGSAPKDLTVIGTTLYFTADDGVTGRELWKTDGTEAGTVRVKDIRAGEYGADPGYFATFGSTLYFTADDGVMGRVPWKTDGSAGGTVPVEESWEMFVAGNAATLRAVGSIFYFTAGSDDELWKTDGTEQGTVLVKAFPKEFPSSSGTTLSDLTAVGSTLYFTTDMPVSGGQVSELWKSDGTPDGTVRLGPADGWWSIFLITPVGSTLYFTAIDGVAGDELWKTDGTAAGTVRVKDICPGPSDSSPNHLIAVGSTLHFTADDGVTGRELWKTDGTEAGTVRVKDIRAGEYGADPGYFATFGSTLYFTADDGVNGEQFWKTDGTEEGTVRVTDVKRGKDSWYDYGVFLSSFGSTLYFPAYDDLTGSELWKTDGTRDGTVRVKDIRPGAAGSESIPLAAVDATLYFAAAVEGTTANDTARVELWKTDGTEAGTVCVKQGILIDFSADEVNPNNFDTLLPVIGSTLYFSATDGTTGYELWKTDGTDAGTVRVKDINAGPSGSQPGSLTVVGSTIYFTADDGVTGRELWKSDGTPAGTVRVKDIRVGQYDSQPKNLTAVGSTLYFTADDGELGRVLWKSDGTEAGTVPVTVTLDGETYNVFKPRLLTAFGSTLYFRNDRGNLWKTDGTTAGTVMVKPNISSDTYLRTVGSTLYFATGNDESAELWKTDGTAAGTVLIKGGEAGVSGVVPGGMAAVGPTLYFTFYDAAQGFQFWKTDGTQTGTVPVADLGDTFPGLFPRFHGSTLFFGGFDMAHGGELWSLSLNSPENSQPTDIALSRATVAENQAAGALVGTLSTTDPDAGDTFTYSLVAGPGAADNGSFRIVGGTLRTAARFNFEAKRTYSVRVRSTDQDGFWTDKVFTINVTDVTEPLVVESVTLPTGDSYKAGERLTFVMNLSLPATVKGEPQLQFKVGSTMRVATYVGGSGTTRLEFRYTVRPNDYAETVSLGARFAPSFAGLGITAGTRRLAAVLPAGVAGAVATGVRIDAVPPRAVGRMTGPAAGSYEVGQALTFVVTFSEKVFVWGGEGAWITLTGITGGPRQAAYVSGSGTNQLTFRYVVQDGDTIAPGKVLTLGNRITLDAGTRIVDRDGKNDALLSISPPSLAKVRLAAALPTSRKSAFAALGRSA